MSENRTLRRRFLGQRGLALVLAAFFTLTGCGTRFDTGTSAAQEELYETLFPYYAEICAVSELEKKAGFGVPLSSGMGGHAVMYLNGACRDEGAGYPTAKLCDAATPAAERGLGISANSHFKNAAWVGTPGRDFFYHGDLAPGERLTLAAYQRTQAKARAMGILDGVAFHSEVFDDLPAGMPRRDYMYEVSVATDYAIGFGRDRYCARVPLDREKMGRIVSYLNALNAPYKDGKKDFDWDVLRNNCSHVTHNALAATGIWDRWEPDRFILIAAFDFPVPKNEFVNLMRRTNDMPIGDPDAIYADASARQDLLQGGSLPTGPGAIAEAERVVAANDIYDTDVRLIFYDDPIVEPYRRRFDRIFSEPRYFDLRANLQHFARLYRDVADTRQPLAAFLARHGGIADENAGELARFYARYYAYVAQANAGVNAELALLRHSLGTLSRAGQ